MAVMAISFIFMMQGAFSHLPATSTRILIFSSSLGLHFSPLKLKLLRSLEFREEFPGGEASGENQPKGNELLGPTKQQPSLGSHEN